MSAYFPEPNTMPQPHAPASPMFPDSHPPPYDGTRQPRFPVQSMAPGFPAQSTAPGFPVQQMTPGFSPAVVNASAASYPPTGPPPQQPVVLGDEFVYLGTLIPNPDAPPLALFKPDSQCNAYRVSDDYLILKSAKKLFGWDQGTLTKKLVELNVKRLKVLSDYVYKEERKTLAEWLPSKKSTMSSWFDEVVHGRALGPVAYDAHLVRRAVEGVTTNKQLLVELLLNRTNVEMEALKKRYKKEFGYSMEDDVSEEFSAVPQSMFNRAMEGSREAPNTPVNYVEVARQVDSLHKYGLGKNSSFVPSMFWDAFITPSDAHISAIVDEYNRKYKNLRRSIKGTPGIDQDIKLGLLYIIDSVKSKRNNIQQGFTGAWRDAKLLEKSMKGMGTNDEALSYRVVRASWSPQRMKEVKDAYHRRYNVTLEKRVRGETSDWYKKILIGLIEKEN